MLMIREQNERHLRELRLFLEEICCNLLRLEHVDQDDLRPEQIEICQEVDLGIPRTYADIRVEAPCSAPYFVEVKYGYHPEELVDNLARKYGMK